MVVTEVRGIGKVCRLGDSGLGAMPEPSEVKERLLVLSEKKLLLKRADQQVGEEKLKANG